MNSIENDISSQPDAVSGSSKKQESSKKPNLEALNLNQMKELKI